MLCIPKFWDFRQCADSYFIVKRGSMTRNMFSNDRAIRLWSTSVLTDKSDTSVTSVKQNRRTEYCQNWHTMHVVMILWFLSYGRCFANGFDRRPVVRIESGDVSGLLSETRRGRPVYGFEGIPYAAAPLGNLRFQVNARGIFPSRRETFARF